MRRSSDYITQRETGNTGAVLIPSPLACLCRVVSEGRESFSGQRALRMTNRWFVSRRAAVRGVCVWGGGCVCVGRMYKHKTHLVQAYNTIEISMIASSPICVQQCQLLFSSPMCSLPSAVRLHVPMRAVYNLQIHCQPTWPMYKKRTHIVQGYTCMARRRVCWMGKVRLAKI